MKKLKSIRRAGAFALPLAITCSGSVFADPVVVDPDGAGGDDPIVVDTLDWNQSSTLSTDVIAPIEVGDTFRALTSARLGNFQLENNNVPGTGLNDPGPGGYEWTVVIALEELVTGVADPDMDGFNEVATFRALSDEPSLLHIFHDPAQNSNQLLGLRTATARS